MAITRALVDAVLRQYRLPLNGIHGVGHWARVGETGARLAPLTGADPLVVELFALFHDACRRNESFDPGHGRRGARLARSLSPAHRFADAGQIEKLVDACSLHARGQTESHVTVQTCWDADRLDLGRVGIRPRPDRLCTEAARDPHLLRWADARAREGVYPPLLRDWGLDWPR